MSSPLQRAFSGRTANSSRIGRVKQWGAWPPAVLGTAAFVVAPAIAGADVGGVVRYTVWTALWWLLGYAVVRRRTPLAPSSAWFVGGLVGIVAQLANWLLWQLLGLPSGTVVGGIVAAAFGGVALVRNTGQGDRARVPVVGWWVWAVGVAWAMFTYCGALTAQKLPPGPAWMYQDLWWHAGLTTELMRTPWAQVPHAQLGSLNYHWLANAHMASGALGSFTDPVQVTVLLWPPAMAALGTGLVLLAARRITRSWLGGYVATVLFTFGAGIRAGYGGSAGAPTTSWAWLSPSQVFTTLFVIALVVISAEVLRGRRITPAFGALFLGVAVLAAGTKSSNIPVVFGGVAFTALCFLRHREVRARALVAGAVCLGALGVAVLCFAGGSSGAGFSLLGTFRKSGLYVIQSGVAPPVGLTDAGLEIEAVSTALVVLLLFVGAFFVYGHLAAAVALRSQWRTDPVPTFLLGTALAGLGGYLFIYHVGSSQGYFGMTMLPMVAILSGWGVDRAWQAAAPERRTVQALVGGAVGLVLAVTAYALAASTRITRGGWPIRTLLVVVLVAAALALLAFAARRRSALVVGLVVALALPVATWRSAQAAVTALTAEPTPKQSEVHAGEVDAAHWLRDHSDRDDLVATNVHCSVVRTAKDCDVRAFWVTASTERRQLLESWGYVDQTQAMAGRNGLPYTRQPYFDQRTFAQNEAVFYSPDAEAMTWLRNKGVRWLFADDRAKKVSPKLAEFADPVHRTGTVTIYRLR